jgi:chlorophyll synthase
MARLTTLGRLESAPTPGACLELIKPVTWFPPMWAFLCGLASVAGPVEIPAILLGVLLCGPLVCGTSQAINDWFDRDVDAINEPLRPIPSGRIPGYWGLGLAIAGTVASLLVSIALGRIVVAATVVGLLLAWAYSAPPLRLKRNGWWGNSAVGLCYEGLPWVTGAALVAGGLPGAPVLALALLYSIGAHGIMTLNDFKSIEGDLRMGIGSLPARLGAPRAARVACAFMAVPQGVVVLLLALQGHPISAALVAASLAAQCLLMRRLLQQPRDRAPWYNATGVTLFVAGMMVSALAVRGGGVS